MPNRLAKETSPYLLQHKDNPVDWYPWGEEALGRAREEDKPIFLSVGYSACHWCHVMERESFEDVEVAAYMNEHFVPVKVDREERPDLDAVYMDAVQAMTGRGGWPMTVFLDTDALPFFGGTYFPPRPDGGMPGLTQLMETVVDVWKNRRDDLESAALDGLNSLRKASSFHPTAEEVDPKELNEAQFRLHDAFDSVNGGFGGAPKFPLACVLEFMLRRYIGGHDENALGVVSRTLTAMADGGIHDQVGGGFARYTVDKRWLVPHFEKMLYDNALLARSYLHGWQVTGDPYFREVCERTLDWALRDMCGPEGGFYSAMDADSEGEEGRFYVWSLPELRELLGDDSEAMIQYWGATEQGNFDGNNILYVADRSAADIKQIERANAILLDARSKRVWPHLDKKRITSWNALMVSALADAGAIFGRDDYLHAAKKCASFLLETMVDPNGTLLRSYSQDRAQISAFLEDHAYMVEALLTLYQATFETRWFKAARTLADTMIEHFADNENEGFFTTSNDHEQLIVRLKDFQDHPIPSGNSSAASGLLTLAKLTGDKDYEEKATGVFRLFHRTAVSNSEMFAHLLSALDFHFSSVKEVSLVGGGLQQMLDEFRSSYRPNAVIAACTSAAEEDAAAIPLLQDRPPVDAEATAYICEDSICQSPITDLNDLKSSL